MKMKWHKNNDVMVCLKDNYFFTIRKGQLGLTHKRIYWVDVAYREAMIYEFVRFGTLFHAKRFCEKHLDGDKRR